MGMHMKFGIITALILGLGAPVAASPVASAEPLLIVPGAEYVALDQLLPKTPAVTRYYTHAIDIGKGFFPDSTPSIVEYPGSIFIPGGIPRHVAIGATNLDAALKAVGGPAIDAGYSRNDAPGSTKPYLSHGVIRKGTGPAAAAKSATVRGASPLPAAAQKTVGPSGKRQGTANSRAR